MYTWLTSVVRPKNVSWVPAGVSLSRDEALLLGRRLAELRKAKGLTQEALAHQVGISRNHLQLLELGLSDRAKRTPSNPQLSTLAALCRQLGATFTIDFQQPSVFTVKIDARR